MMHPHVISISAISLLVIGANTVKPVMQNLANAKATNVSFAAGSSKQVTALRRAIIGQESGHKFYLVNPHSGALGYAQLMPANVRPWTSAALGKALTPKEFLHDRNAQIKTIDHRLNLYLQRELAKGFSEEKAIRRVASTWYSGQPSLWNNVKPQYYNGHRYPSIENYTRSVWNKYLKEKQNV
ncbi:MAG TPA: hypothetical protein VIQ31_35615 [Phormidium sp.]